MVEFGGWSMPVQYTSITEEHQAVRNRVGLFDISHMGRLVFEGPEAERWLEQATTNNVAKLAPGRIQYSLLVNEQGGTLDDVLVYRMLDNGLRMVCNASNRVKVTNQLNAVAKALSLDPLTRAGDHTMTTAMIAVQGPKAEAALQRILGTPLGPIGSYQLCEGLIIAGPAIGTHAVVSRTGYTGEDGFELIVPSPLALPVWETLLDAGREFDILPCGLGARDTLRFEAAMPLYGHELDESINPYAAGLGWVVKLNKGDFVGREALRGFKTNPGRTRIGLALEGKRIARQGCPVRSDGNEVGVVTSGTFSPTLGRSLAMALVEPAAATVGARLVVDVRGRDEPAEVVPLPFYRRP
jgi:aminomethyltransferase